MKFVVALATFMNTIQIYYDVTNYSLIAIGLLVYYGY